MTDHKRGELEIRQFSAAIMERLNDPRNIEKGDWRRMQRGDLLSALIHEVGELAEEISYTCPDPDEVRKEASDVAAYAMMLADWTEHHWDGEKLEDSEHTNKLDGLSFFHVNGVCYEVEMYESEDGYSAFTPQMRGVEGRGPRQFDTFYDLKERVIAEVESE